MNSIAHILNGDALLDHFPESIVGKRIVMRECLMDGNVRGDSLNEFYHNRANFLLENTENKWEIYRNKTVVEIEKMLQLPADSEVLLWFEDDLFCQVNFWFCSYLLHHFVHATQVYLIRPTYLDQWGFGKYSSQELEHLYSQKTRINDLSQIAKLWLAYKEENWQDLKIIAEELKNEHPFILPAVQAHLDRIPNHKQLGKPEQITKQILKDLDTKDFGKVFSAFNEKAPIYGYGDVQFRRIYNRVIQLIE